MKNTIITASIIVFTFIGTALAGNNISSVSPDIIKMRHSANVSVQVENILPDSELSIIPGGTYIEHRLNIHSENSDLFLNQDTPVIITDHTERLSFGSFVKENFEHISAQDSMLAISHKNKIEIFSHLQKTTEIELFSNITQLSISDKVICATLKGNTLTQIDLKDNSTNSTTLNDAPTTLATRTSDCITATNHEITLWSSKNNTLFEHSKIKLNSRIHKIITYQNLLLVANGRTGLTILEIDNQNQLHWKSSYNKLGNIINIANDATTVLVSDDEGILTLIDIIGANRPLLISDIYLGFSPRTLLFRNNKAYTLANKTITTINFESQSSPLISTLGVNQGGSRRSFIDKDILYVADWFSGIHLYDISTPHNPKLISSYHTPGSPKGILVRNNIAYVADDDHGLQILDVSKPRNPKLLSNLPLDGLAYTMKLRHNMLYLASHYGGFHIIDISVANKPKLVGSINTPGKPWALALKDNELFVADDQNGLLVFDITNPEKPTLTTQFNPGGFAEDIIIRNNRAYLAFFDLGLFVLDISDSQNIKLLSSLKTPGSARGIDIKGDTLYLASWEAGVSVIDISDEKSPKLKSYFDTDGATWGLSVKDDYVYAMDWWGGVKVIDANNKNRLRQIAKYQTSGVINDIKMHKNFLYTAHGSRGLQIYEATNTLNPVWSSGIDIVGDARALAVNNSLAIIASEDNGLNIIDISNSFQPKWLSNINLGEKLVNVSLLGTTAVALAETGQVISVDLTNPKFPEVILSMNLNTKQIQTQNQTLWVLNNNSELVKFSLSNPSSLKKEATYTLNSQVIMFFAKENNVYIVDSQNTISKYRVEDNKLSLVSSLNIGYPILDIFAKQNLLYITSANRQLNILKDNDKLQLVAQYPSTHRIEKIAASTDGVFFSGESLIASGKLLPHLDISKSHQGFQVSIPKNMPLGSYHVSIIDTHGNQQIKLNAFEIGFPKFKPKFSMEDLKRKMKEKNLSGKANTP